MASSTGQTAGNTGGGTREPRSRTERPSLGIGHWSVWGPVALVGIGATWVVVLLGGYAVKQVWIISRYLSPLSPVILLALGLLGEWMLGGTDLSRQAQARRRASSSPPAWCSTFFLEQLDDDQPGGAARPEVSRRGARNVTWAPVEWLRDNTPEDAVVAALDIGAVGYASDRPVLDLMGLVSPEILSGGAETGLPGNGGAGALA